MVSDYHRPWTPATLVASQVSCWSLGNGEIGVERDEGRDTPPKSLRYPHSLGETQHKFHNGFL